MDIFYAGSIGSQDKQQDKVVSDVIPSYLKKSGHKVYTYIYSPENENGHTFEELMDRINKSDAYVGEMSRASQTLGFQLAYALLNSKPCLYLYLVGRHGNPGAPIAGNPNRLLKIQSYEPESINKVLSKFTLFAETKLTSTRTSFLSTNGIDEFLNKQSKLQGLSKGELIRQILDKAAQ